MRGLWPLPLLFGLLMAGCATAVPTVANITPSPTARPSPVVATPTHQIPVSTAPATQPTWAKLGLDGVELRAVAVEPGQPNVVYAVGQGLYKSTDGGKHWETLREDVQLAHLAIGQVGAHAVYAGAALACLRGEPTPGYISSDGGNTWQATDVDLGAFVPDPVDPKVVYATGCGGIYKSTDSGRTWVRLEKSWIDPGYDGMALAISPGSRHVLYGAFVSEGGSIRVTKTEDGGSTWEDVTPQEEVWGGTSIAIEPSSPSVIYIATGKGVWQSPDSGRSWKPMNRGLEAVRVVESTGFERYEISVIIADPRHPNSPYLGTGKGVFVYQWATQQWSRLSSGVEERAVRGLALVPALAAGDPDYLYAATDSGIYRLMIDPP